MAEILRNVAGRLLGLDKDDSLVIGGTKIIFGHNTKSDIAIDLRALAASTGGIPGAAQNGVTDDLPAFNAAVAQLAGAKANWVVFGVLFLNGNPTIPPNVSLTYLPGGIIKTSANKSIAYQSVPNAALSQQIFDISNGGVSVTMPPGLILDCSGEWFGATGDGTGVILSTNAYKAAITFAHSAGDINIRAFPVQYNFDDMLPLSAGSFTHPNLIGAGGKKKTIFNYPNIASGLPCIRVRGGSGQLSGNFIANIDFVGNANSIGVEFNGQCGSWVENCFFDTNAVGARWHNETSGSFTEFCTIRGCDFRSTCTLPREYKVTSGNNSFHGSGSAVAKCTYAIGAGPYIQIDGPGCFVYNAPTYDAVFATSANAVLIQNNNSVAPFAASFAGMFELETNSSRNITFAAGQPVLFVKTPIQILGGVTGSGNNILAGTLIRVDTHMVYQDGSSSFTGAVTCKQLQLTSGVTLVDSVIRNVHRRVYVDINASNYRKQLTLDVSAFGDGSTIVTPGVLNTSQTIPTPNTSGTSLQSVAVSFDSTGGSGYGTPSFTGNTNGSFNIVAPTEADTFTGTFSGGETSGTLNANWNHKTGTYNFVFSNGDTRAASCTLGVAGVDWSAGGGGLSSAATAVATSSLWPTSGVSAYITEMQEANGIQGAGHIQF